MRSNKQYLIGFGFILGAAIILNLPALGWALDLTVDGIGSLSAGSSGSLQTADKAVGMLNSLLVYWWELLTVISVFALSITGWSAFVSKRPEAMKSFFMVCVGVALAFMATGLVSFIKGLAAQVK
jgi:hypothetical protein